VKFSVVTPSFGQLSWLKRCVRSVADQAGIEVEHVIQDAGTEGIADCRLRIADRAAGYEQRLFVEKDSGMYDALNRGFARATGDVISILNCDEQYLPGALARMRETFEKTPEADMIVGDWLVVDADGRLRAFRRATKLRPSMILTDHLYDFTCAMFFRRRLIERGIRFDTQYRAAGDADFVARLLRTGVRVAHARAWLAAFAVTGTNLSARADSAQDVARLQAITPPWARLAGPFLRQWRHVEKLFAGGYRSKPIEYEIYAREDDTRRTRFFCEKPSFRHSWE
jgi:glycosyltransferase involved in cell wall biosynthesis